MTGLRHTILGTHESQTPVVTVLRILTRLIQFALGGIVIYTGAIGTYGVSASTLIMLAIAIIPDVLRFRYGLRPLPVVAFIVAIAPFLHAVGTLGPYQTIPAFDQVAHSVSATLVAGIGYVVVRTLDTEYDSVSIPPKLRFVFVIIFATSFGVIWESLEFGSGLLAMVIGGDPLLAQYGTSDVALDLLFNTIGAFVIALWGTSYFDGLRHAVAGYVDGD